MSLNLLSGGSSPLARGTQLGIFWHPYQFGLIPARAGNTAYPDCAEVSRRAHPRSRGEHFNFEDGQTEKAGSSPLARGTLKRTHIATAAVGLIPARAGNTPSIETLMRHTGAHPRSRGEHQELLSMPVRFLGSSPLARGTLTVLLRQLSNHGLIPARAGNTPYQFVTTPPTKAHPRSRGEHPGKSAG